MPRGRELPSRVWCCAGRTIVLVVDTAGARASPLTVDPLVEQESPRPDARAKVAERNRGFGFSHRPVRRRHELRSSGAPGRGRVRRAPGVGLSTRHGIRAGRQQGPKLTAPESLGQPRRTAMHRRGRLNVAFGRSVALSADGGHGLLIGAPPRQKRNRAEQRGFFSPLGIDVGRSSDKVSRAPMAAFRPKASRSRPDGCDGRSLGRATPALSAGGGGVGPFRRVRPQASSRLGETTCHEVRRFAGRLLLGRQRRALGRRQRTAARWPRPVQKGPRPAPGRGPSRAVGRGLDRTGEAEQAAGEAIGAARFRLERRAQRTGRKRR